MAARSGFVMLHGSGDTGLGVRAWASHAASLDDRLEDRGVALRFPDAPSRPYTLMGGHASTVWFDRTELHPAAPEDSAGIAASVRQVLGVLDELERTEGVPSSRVVVGGYSMGGCLALHVLAALAAARRPVAGVFCFSAFLADSTPALAALRAAYADGAADGAAPPPVLMYGGGMDELAKVQWVLATSEALRAVGVPVSMHVIDEMEHELHPDEVGHLVEWTLERLAQADGGSGGGGGAASAHRGGGPSPLASAEAEAAAAAARGAAAAAAREPEALHPAEALARVRDVTYALDKRADGDVVATFAVPTGAVEVLCKMPVMYNGGTFQFAPVDGDAGAVSTTFYSPDPDKTAEVLAKRLAGRMADPGSRNVDECAVS